MINRIVIENFKNISTFESVLTEMNVLVGSNNSGKSSVLHALHFAVSVAQSRPLLPNQYKITAGGVVEGLLKKDEAPRTFTIAPNQLLYSPTGALAYLSLQAGSGIEDEETELLGEEADPATEPDDDLVRRATAIRIVLCTETNDQGDVRVQIMKTGHLRVILSGDKALARIEGLENPYSIYVPGLAGLARTETLMPWGLLRRAVARGDANLVLRNVLYRLQRETTNWPKFMTAVRQMFPDTDISISFEDGIDEHIDVIVSRGGPWLPLDCKGTGFLQTIQILSYIYLFNPRIVLLDEPDAHLHPNNQRLLGRLLEEMAAEGQTQVALATHSRHILDALQQPQTRIWLRSGEKAPITDHLDVLFDIGALDSAEGLLGRGIKLVILTEDAGMQPIKTAISAIMSLSECQFWSYKGCTNFQTAVTIGKFIHEVSPKTKIIVHRDSDYLEELELESIRKEYARHRLEVFFTPGVDIEAVFCNLEHLQAIKDNDAEAVGLAYQTALGIYQQQIVAEAIYGAMAANTIRQKAKLNEKTGEEIAGWASTLSTNDKRWVKGKSLLKILLRLYKDATKKTLKVYDQSKHIVIQSLRELINK